MKVMSEVRAPHQNFLRKCLMVERRYSEVLIEKEPSTTPGPFVAFIE
jgi:hypothetical protein